MAVCVTNREVSDLPPSLYRTSTCLQPEYRAEEMVRNMVGQKQGQAIQNHLKKYALYQEGDREPPEGFKA